MTTKEKNDLKTKVTTNGGRNSAYDPNVQFINGVKVTHIDTNRTKIDTTTYYGSSAANQALDGL
ncbi:MAG TPA: hypothetical protein VF939_21025 [Puia sp.]